MDKIDLAILEKIINDEIKSQLDSGYKLNSEYVIILRNLLKKLNLKEYWDYDKKYGGQLSEICIKTNLFCLSGTI